MSIHMKTRILASVNAPYMNGKHSGGELNSSDQAERNGSEQSLIRVKLAPSWDEAQFDWYILNHVLIFW